MAADAVRIGIGGPVGSGKTRLIERLLPLLHARGLRVAVITNDLVTREDAERLQGSGLIEAELVVGVETGACPHTAIREDPSLNLAAAEQLEREHDVDVVLVESGGDNLASTFSADLVDRWIYVIDVAAGDDIPRKRGLGLLQADLLVVNKTDLAHHVGADLERMRADLAVVRPERPTVFTDLRDPSGAECVLEHLVPNLHAGAVVPDGGRRPATSPERTILVRLDRSLAPEELVAQAARLGHALGNQHVPLEVEGGEIRVPGAASPERTAETVSRLSLRGAEIEVSSAP